MFHHKHPFSLYCIATLIIFYASYGCSNYSQADRIDSLFNITEKVHHYYKLDAPNETYSLPQKLLEISGISYVGKNVLLCVEDENGIVYTYDLGLKRVISERRFAGDGDFEDLAFTGDRVFILKSNGHLYHFSYADNDIKSNHYNTPLKSEHDTEGLCYDPVSKNLLITCKERKDLNGEKTEGNDVYLFSLDDKKLADKPFFSLTSKNLKTFFEENRSFIYEEERINIKPSGIAHNPLDDYFYILASVGKMLIAVDRTGRIMASYSIPETLLRQPEGITFSPTGDLWISTEGEKGSGRILHYKPVAK